jgi:ethanolaminephosphotransferase
MILCQPGDTEKTMSDDRKLHIWVAEVETPDGCVLTLSGVSAIAHHKYKSGHYTFLDNFLNPFWQRLTDQLPLGLAPNTVTAVGGSCCLLSYLLTAHYNFDLQQRVPDWLLLVNGLCLFTYYTFDCMDGKQARRTKSSTPLGQLFDHGMDCVCNLSHVSLMQNIVGLKGVPCLWLQISLQIGFFQAQWEEYYTGTLPHAVGNIGATEVLYGIALWAVGSGLGMIDRTIYSQEIPQYFTDYLLKLPAAPSILGNNPETTHLLHYRDLFILVWVYGYGSIAFGSFLRVQSQIASPKILCSALTKLLSPLSLCAAAIYVGNELNDNLPDNNNGGIRYPSLCIGLVFCIITVKLIVLGMARMAFATLQLDIIPIWLILGLYRLESPFMPSPATKVAVLQQTFALASVAYLIRLVWWTKRAMDQICQRLQIQPFGVVPQSPSKEKKKSL